MNNILLKAVDLIEAIYANLEPAEFSMQDDKSKRLGNIIVGIHIREELMALEEAIEPTIKENHE